MSGSAPRPPLGLTVLSGLAAAAVPAAIGVIFLIAPVEARMGWVQKIFYVHVPSALAAYAGFVLCGVGSLGVLVSRDERWDALAVAGAEVGLVFCALVLTTGPLWAQGAWGVPWVWDPQLTTTLLLFLLYLVYLFLRSFSQPGGGGRRLAAVLGLLGTLDIYVIHTSVTRWRGQHPAVVRRGGGGLLPEMWAALAVAALAILLVFSLLLVLRYRLERTRQAADRLALDLAEVS